jgi:hypothetical protein
VDNSRGDVSSKSSDDEELKIIEDKVIQPRTLRVEEKRSSSSPRHSRITSPVAPTSSANPPYLTPFGANFQARRTPNDSETTARENAERSASLQAAAYLYGANLQYQQNSPYLSSNVRTDVPVMLPIDPSMFYGGMYKQHMMDASQGGAVMQDPLTGSLVVVPEALINQNLFNPLGKIVSHFITLDGFFDNGDDDGGIGGGGDVGGGEVHVVADVGCGVDDGGEVDADCDAVCK